MLKVFVIAFFASAVLCQMALDESFIDQVNKDSSSTWKAGWNSKFAGWTLEDAKRILLPSYEKPSLPSEYLSDMVFSGPSSYDVRNATGCANYILDQGQCGSCWAFGTSESLSDRFCIADKSKYADLHLSPQKLVSCDVFGNMGCSGGQPHLAFDYMEAFGLPTLACYPYVSGSGDNPLCKPFHCPAKGQDDTHYRAKALSTHGYGSEAHMKKAIYEDGPVAAVMEVYHDLFSYTGGVYVRKSDQMMGGHVVKVLGWGDDPESGLPYWIVANSWGYGWGLKGYFLITRGEGNCGITTGGVAAKPKL